MVVPWVGIPLADMLKRFQPTRVPNTLHSRLCMIRSGCRARSAARLNGHTWRAYALTRP